MNNPEVSIGCVSNLFSKMMHFVKAGDMELGHAHTFDHLTLLAKGRLRVICEGNVTEFTAPHMIYIKQEKNHTLIALEDDTVAYCIHALRENDTGDILDPTMIPTNVNPMQDCMPLLKQNV